MSRHATDQQILSIFDIYSNARTGTIARLLRDDRAAILRRMKRLERNGMVERHPVFSCPKDLDLMPQYIDIWPEMMRLLGELRRRS